MDKETRDRLRKAGVSEANLEGLSQIPEALAQWERRRKSIYERDGFDPLLLYPESVFDPATGDRPGVILSPNAERDEWCFRQYVDRRKVTIRAFRSEAKSKGWILSSDQAFRKAVKSHCDSLEIDMPRRKQKRTKPK